MECFYIVIKNAKIVIQVVENVLEIRMMNVLNVKVEKYYIMDNVIKIAHQELIKIQQEVAVYVEKIVKLVTAKMNVLLVKKLENIFYIIKIVFLNAQKENIKMKMMNINVKNVTNHVNHAQDLKNINVIHAQLEKFISKENAYHIAQ